jgi:DNA-binding CsgD family transcriptional regulator
MKSLKDFKLELGDSFKPSLTLKAFDNKVKSIVNNLGFSDVDIAVNSANDNGVDFLISTAPSKMYDTYIKESLYNDDLILDYLLKSQKLTFTAEAVRFFTLSPYKQITKIQQCDKIMEIFADYQYYDSYTIPITINKDLSLLISIMQQGQDETVFRRNIDSVKAYIDCFGHHIAETIAFPGCIQSLQKEKNRFILSPKEIQVLTALAKHPVTQTKLAVFLNVSERTIQDRIKSIKQKLGAQTLCECIYKATLMRYIT